MAAVRQGLRDAPEGTRRESRVGMEEEKNVALCRGGPRVHLARPAGRGGQEGHPPAGHGADRLPVGAPVDEDQLDGFRTGDLPDVVDERIKAAGFVQDGDDDGHRRALFRAHPVEAHRGSAKRLRISSIRLRFTLKS